MVKANSGAYAVRYPDRTDKLVVLDAPVPGIAPWDEIVRDPFLHDGTLIRRRDARYQTVLGLVPVAHMVGESAQRPVDILARRVVRDGIVQRAAHA